ncbi:MAG: D-glycero-alpha-D-manno-heptose-1,7-bisphosphate 7-phosphatase [Planctomycetota bacterium]|jgi:D,D-heptose 1,7-bisphosphate phosphatase
MTRSEAVFFDRDNTLIEDPGFINDPDQVRLVNGAPEAIARLRQAGYRIVVVTNQSGLARGLVTERQLEGVHRRLEELLASRGATLDGIYFCPYLDGPEATVEGYRQESHLRKPAPGMLLQAAQDLQIDLGRSWLIGDAARDIEAGRRAGCRTVLVERDGADQLGRDAGPTHVVGSLREAADMVLKQDVDPGAPQKPAGPEASSASGRASGCPPDDVSSDRSLQLLTEIRDLLDRSTRSRLQEDFSLLRLCGTLVQMLAVVVAVWGLFALFSDNNAAAIARFALAAFLQLATLTLHVSDRRN